MKADLVEYICALSENKQDVLEEILVKKYKKFVNFFELVREYGDDIVKLHYNPSEKNILDVVVTMRGNVKSDVRSEFKEELEQAGYQVTTAVSKRKLSIILIYEE